MNAMGRTRRRAHETRDTFHAAVFIFVQPVHAAIRPQVHAAVFNRHVLSALFGILNDAIRAGERFGLDPREIIVELGRRRVVVGQEDAIVGIAADMLEAGRAP